MICRCRADFQAWEKGEPFCCYCGMPISFPHFANHPLWAPLLIKERSSEIVLRFQPDFHGGRGQLDTRRLLDSRKVPRLLAAEIRSAIGELRPASFTAGVEKLSISIPALPVTDRTAFPMALRLTFRLAGACREYKCELPLQPENFIAVCSSDPRIENRFSEESIADARLLLIDGVSVDIVIELRSANLDFGAVDSAVLISGPDQECELKFQRLPAGPLSVTVPMPILQKAVGANSSVQALLLLWQGGRLAGSVRMDIQRCALPVLRLPENAGCTFSFEREAWWCGDGTPVRQTLSKSENWLPHFSLQAQACESLAAAASFTAEIHSTELLLRARLFPRWVNSKARHELPGDESDVRGTLNLFLRNDRNDSAQQLSLLPLWQASAVLKTVARNTIELLAIDFGTTNTASAVCAHRGGLPSEIRIDGSASIPSQLFYAINETGVDLSRSAIGDRAAQMSSRDGDTALLRSDLKTDLLRLARRPDASADEVGTPRVTPLESARHFLELYLRDLAASRQIDGRAVRNMTFTFPAACPSGYREMLATLLKEAAVATGLLDEKNIHAACDEASAGGIYWFKKNLDALKLKDFARVRLLVYDYGGGTSDMSVIEFSALAAEGRWQIKLLGVAGMPDCGGDDLTWRLARKFCACVWREIQNNTATPLKNRPFLQDGRLRRELPTRLRKHGRREWRAWCPSLLAMIEERKKSALSLPDGVLIDAAMEALLLPNVSRFDDLKEEKVSGHAARSESGRFGATRFPGWVQEGESFRPVSRNSASLSGDDFWCFDLNSELFQEPEAAIGIARNLIRAVGGIDHLLVIGQASHTHYFRERLKQELQGLFKEMHTLEAEQAKTCVAMGACVFQTFRREMPVVPTILKRLVLWSVSLNAPGRYLTVLPSFHLLNTFCGLEGETRALFKNPGELELFVDSSNRDKDPAPALRDPLKAALVCLQKGFGETDQPIEAGVFDPSASGFETAAPQPIRDLIVRSSAAHPRFKSAFWLAFWPAGQPEHAWIYAYHV